MTPASFARRTLNAFELLGPVAAFVGLYILSVLAAVFSSRAEVFDLAFIAAIPILVALSIVDYWSHRIPDLCNLGLAALGCWVAVSKEVWTINLTVAIILGLLLWAASEWYFRKKGTDPLGLGDIKLIAALSVWLGPERLPVMLFLASTTGIVLLVLQRLKTRASQRATADMQLEVPFGPFLAYSFFLTLVTTAV